MGDVQSIIDELWSDAPSDFPFFREKATTHGNKQHIENNDISRVSRISRHEDDVSYTSLVEDETGARMSACERARVEGGVFEPGNAGIPGNVSDLNNIPFPLEVSKTGNDGKSLSAGCPTVTSWRIAFAGLTASALPCPGLLAREWPAVYAAAHHFLEDHAEAAHALGWDAISLFGVHPVVGATRVDCCGALMVSSGARVVLVERDVISFGRGRFFRRALTPDAVLVWEFGR